MKAEVKPQLELKALRCFMPIKGVEAGLLQLGFTPTPSATVVSEGKFWRKTVFIRNQETVSLSEEIGDAYPKDPVVTICGFRGTIDKLKKLLR